MPDPGCQRESMVTGTCVSLHIHEHTHRISPVPATPGAMRPGEDIGDRDSICIGIEGR